MTIIDGDTYPETLTFCGHTLKQIGIGAYPYDCISKNKYPNAMIYDGFGWDAAILKKDIKQ